MSEVISASQFKARCLALLDGVAETGAELIVTKRGEPVAKVVPLGDEGSLAGSVTYLVTDEELLAPIEVEWDAAKTPDG